MRDCGGLQEQTACSAMILKRREGRELRAAEKVVTYREQPGGLMRDLIANQVEYIGFDSNCAVTDVISFGKIQHFSGPFEIEFF